MTVLLCNWSSTEENAIGGAEIEFGYIRKLLREMGQDVQLVTYQKAAGALGVKRPFLALSEPYIYGGRVIGKYLEEAVEFLEPELIIKKSMIAWQSASRIRTPQITTFQDVHHIAGKMLYEANYYDLITQIQHCEVYPQLQAASAMRQEVVLPPDPMDVSPGPAQSTVTKDPQHINLRVGASEFVAEMLAPLEIPMEAIIPPPVDYTLFKPASTEFKHTLRERYGIPRDKPVGIWVGRFHPQKGYHIIRDLIHRFPQVFWVLVFAAERPFEPMCKNVKILPPVDHDKMPEYYQLADFLCLPSCCEAANMSIAEGAGCNLPFITYQTGTWYKTPATGAGLVATKWNTDEFALLVQSMLYIVREGQKTKPRAVVKPIYGLDSWKEAWGNLLRFILE